MEKEYFLLDQSYNKEAEKNREILIEKKISLFEQKSLYKKYDTWFFIPKVCYTEINEELSETEVIDIDAYNTKCKQGWVPENEIRPEIENIYKNWNVFRKNIEWKKAEINNRIYADKSWKGKLDKDIVNMFTVVAWVWLIISLLLLLIFTRIPKETTLKKSRSKKAE